MIDTESRDQIIELQHRLGERIRRLRRERGMTQSNLANHVGVTNGQISTIERGLSAPSVGTLIRIASALEASIVNFLEPAPGHHVRVVRRDHRVRVTTPGSGEVVELLADGRYLSAAQIDLPPGASTSRPAGADPADHITYVMHGDIEFGCDGSIESLKAGDCAQTDGRSPRTLRNVGESPASVIEVKAVVARA